MQIFGYVLACRLYSFVCTVHHLIIVIVQTYRKALNLQNACQIYFVECVSKIKHILSVIHYTICGTVCFQFTHFLSDDLDNIYTLSYYHHQIGRMNYYPLFRVRSWNNGVRCMSFYILTRSYIIIGSAIKYFWNYHQHSYIWSVCFDAHGNTLTISDDMKIGINGMRSQLINVKSNSIKPLILFMYACCCKARFINTFQCVSLGRSVETLMLLHCCCSIFGNIMPYLPDNFLRSVLITWFNVNPCKDEYLYSQ